MDKKQNQPTEIEELDLSLPDDLNLSMDEPPLPSDTGLDDLDLELPELTEDEDHTLSGETMAEPAGLDEAGVLAQPDDLEDEPIALSEEELERIVGSADTEIFHDMPEGSGHETAAHSDDILTDVNEDLPSGFDMDLADASMESGSGMEMDAGTGEVHGHEHTDSSLDFSDMHSDLDDEGPVSLSEEELGNIMGDVHEPAVDYEGAHPETAQQPVEHGEDFGSIPPAVPGAAMAMDDDEEDNITLSDDELSNILLDASDLEGARPEGEPHAPPLSEMGIDDDDEPIALTPEELGNIISDVSDVQDHDGSMHDESMHMDAMAPDMEAGHSTLLDEHDEGPVALSDAELDSILEDVSEEHHAEGVPAAPHSNLIMLDDYADQEAREQAQKREATLENIAQDKGIHTEELKKMISYLDQLFDKLPEDTVREFSHSEYFDLYKKIMQDLGLT